MNQHEFLTIVCINVNKYQILYLNIGKRGARVMGKTTDMVSSVTMVVRVATERRVQAKFTAFLNSLHILIYRVHSLQDTTNHFLELTEFRWLFHTVIL